MGSRVLQLLDHYHGTDPKPEQKRLVIVCWRSRDTRFADGYRLRLQGILEHIRSFYAREMERHGLGPRTFLLEYDESGSLIVHETVGTKDAGDYDQRTGGGPIREECWKSLRAAGLDPDRETVVIFTNLADWDPDRLTFSHHSPYQGTGDFRRGVAWQLDHAGLAVSNLSLKAPLIQDREYGRISLGKHNSIFIGGIAHELGHALGLPHGRESADEARTKGTSLMGSGNRTYGDELRGEGMGSFLTLADALRLAAHPLFSGSAKGIDSEVSAGCSHLTVRSAPRSFTVFGTITSSIPVYAVTAHLDPVGGSDYDANTSAAIPDDTGSFTLKCADLVAGKPAELRLHLHMANGAVRTLRHTYFVHPDGAPDVTAMEVSMALAPLLSISPHEIERAKALTANWPQGSRMRESADRLIAARTRTAPSETASTVDDATNEMPLAHIQPEQGRVGWGQPAYDYLPRPEALLIAGGRLFATGIYAHAPALHRYALEGRWKRLKGCCGLPSGTDGTVVFVVRLDGREAFRSKRIADSITLPIELDLTGARQLELITEDAGDSNRGDWACWFDCQLLR